MQIHIILIHIIDDVSWMDERLGRVGTATRMSSCCNIKILRVNRHGYSGLDFFHDDR